MLNGLLKHIDLIIDAPNPVAKSSAFKNASAGQGTQPTHFRQDFDSERANATDADTTGNNANEDRARESRMSSETLLAVNVGSYLLDREISLVEGRELRSIESATT